MAEPTVDLRAELAEAFKRTATAYGRRLGPFRFELADAALEVFDDDARQMVADELMEATRLRSMEIRNGGFSMDVEPAREIATEYVAAARAMLGGAQNYSETPVEFTVGLAGQERYVLVVQRAERPTPHQMRRRAEAERDAFAAEVLIARSLRIARESVCTLVERDVHSPARIRAYLAAHGWVMTSQREDVSGWRFTDRDGIHHDIGVLAGTGEDDYVTFTAAQVCAIATAHQTGELQVLHDIAEAGDE